MAFSSAKVTRPKQDEGNAQPYFVILDEMNLAHVEYYFADFLSVLESGRRRGMVGQKKR
jgi:5-methylcytosine-specific restriction endonuclease McrBC GTP-binding regulatory subunit McrB